VPLIKPILIRILASKRKLLLGIAIVISLIMCLLLIHLIYSLLLYILDKRALRMIRGYYKTLLREVASVFLIVDFILVIQDILILGLFLPYIEG
jgi:hypothetical protein